MFSRRHAHVLHRPAVWLIAAVVSGALCAGVPPDAHATQFGPRDACTLGAVAAAPAVYTVVDKSVQWWGPMGAQRLLTLHVLEDSAGQKETLALPGGELGELGQHVPGTPVLEVGATYALLLGHARSPEGWAGLAGLDAGAWPVVDGVVHVSSAFTLRTPPGDQGDVPRGGTPGGTGGGAGENPRENGHVEAPDAEPVQAPDSPVLQDPAAAARARHVPRAGLAAFWAAQRATCSEAP